MQIDAMEARVKQAEAAEQKAKEEANMFMLRTRKEREELKAIKLRGGTKTEQEEAKVAAFPSHVKPGTRFP